MSRIAGGIMKSVSRLVFWSILCCIAFFGVTAAMPAFAANVPAARLEGDAIEADVVEAPEASAYELPKMDFVPAQVEEAPKPVIRETAPTSAREEPGTPETKSAVANTEPAVDQARSGSEIEDRKAENGRHPRNRKISGRIREYWLKIHADSDAGAVEKKDVAAAVSPKANVISAPANDVRNESAAPSVEPRREGTIVRQIPVEKKPSVEKTEPSVEKNMTVLADSKPAGKDVPEETPAAVEEPKSIPQIPAKKTTAGDRKLSSKVRDFWLKIHNTDEELQVAGKTPNVLAMPDQAKPLIVRQQPGKQSSVKPLEKSEAATGASKIEMVSAEPASVPEPREETFAPASTVTSPPLTEAPVVFQKKSAKLALFSGPLAKMAQRREYRLAEAKRLNIVLPSQGGSFDKLPQSIAKLKTAVEDILTRNGAGMVLSMIFKGHLAGGTTNQKRTRK
ncbi:MAG TPA: hypothetical protein PLU72_08460 [Candidatus Ozemobacteraceae bacterium]|nr:hypothetical protein [Candidatus Ozemobacteraceae bacterium]